MGKFKEIIRIILAISMFVLMALLVNKYLNGYRLEEKHLEGKGTKDVPYQITCVEDLIWLRDKVNSGTNFESVFFLQTCDLDLENMPWEPIGIYGTDRYFYGVYDGGGYTISNLYIPSSLNIACPALFGQLGGQVLNLGIESGYIEGDFAGSIASHCVGENAAIINCYNKANIIGRKRAGGICDNFSKGSVINCANIGEIESPISGGIVSYSGKNLINVYSYDDAYNENFTGSYIQLNDGNAYDNFKDFLSDGVRVINEYKMFEYGYLKIWNR